jgi:poly-beta-1,6-N-acetyl-D-glucosamine synthase
MFTSENLFISAVFIIFCIAAAIQLYYWIWFYQAPLRYKPLKQKSDTPPVSVIICARNEAANLTRFLPAVLEQDYPDFEVVLVNDCSEDRTDEIIGEFLLKYKNLKVSSITRDPKFTHNKKFAQFIGIKAASNDLLVFTDADCQPESDKWLSAIVSNFDKDTEIVLGYGGYMREKGLVNRYIRFDSMFLAMQYLGMALKKIPYMGVGRNLAYRRQLFFRNKGFGGHNHVISGDDDLFVNSVATKQNTKIELSTGSHTRSVPCSTFSQFLSQKQRHFTTAKYYKPFHKFLLFTEPFSRMVFYVSFAFLISVLFIWPYVAAIFLLRIIIQIITLILIQKKLNEKGLVFFSLIFDIFSPLMNILIYMLQMRNRSGQNTWK